ncbi:MAG: hypothetical protein AB1815_01340 [Bacillota bacterium]
MDSANIQRGLNPTLNEVSFNVNDVPAVIIPPGSESFAPKRLGLVVKRGYRPCKLCAIYFTAYKSYMGFRINI